MPAEEKIQVQVRVTEADVSMGPADKALVTHSPLVNGLVRAPDDTLAALIKEIGGPLNLDDVSIDEAGRIVIDNIEFAQKLREKAEEAAAVSGAADGANLICVSTNVLCPHVEE